MWPSQNLLFLPEYTLLFNNYARPSQNLPFLPEYNLFSTKLYVRLSHNLPSPLEYTPLFNNYMRYSQNLPLPVCTPLLNKFICATLPDSNLPPRIYPPFQKQYATLPKGGGGYILGGRCRFWEGRTFKFVEKGVYSGREGQILGASHNYSSCWKRGVYSGREG